MKNSAEQTGNAGNDQKISGIAASPNERKVIKLQIEQQIEQNEKGSEEDEYFVNHPHCA